MNFLISTSILNDVLGIGTIILKIQAGNALTIILDACTTMGITLVAMRDQSYILWRKTMTVEIKFFCDRSGKEMWQGLITKEEKLSAVKVLYEEECVCSDCILAEVLKREIEK